MYTRKMQINAVVTMFKFEQEKFRKSIKRRKLKFLFLLAHQNFHKVETIECSKTIDKNVPKILRI